MPVKAAATETAPTGTLESIDQTVHRPQWQDIGMCDVLAVTGGSTVTPPKTVRLVHDSTSGTSVTTHTSQVAAKHSPSRSLRTTHRTINGYLYLIRCLRL